LALGTFAVVGLRPSAQQQESASVAAPGQAVRLVAAPRRKSYAAVALEAAEAAAATPVRGRIQEALYVRDQGISLHARTWVHPTLLTLCAPCALFGPLPTAQVQPHIILFTVDDLGAFRFRTSVLNMEQPGAFSFRASPKTRVRTNAPHYLF
jgi:hypothetical protein